MFEHAAVALELLLTPIRLLALFAGMVAGMVFGMLPGLGGVAAVSILLPFIYLLDPFAGLALLLGAISVVYTADTITSVLIGAPGSPASAPTAIEGHALAKQGQAARALGVGFLASMVGGILGAAILLFAIPVAGPIVLSLATPELFMFAVVGLYYAASMITRDWAKGLGAACFGLLLGVVGPAPAAADFRFTFDQAYLLDGFSLTIVALGLFGIAEVIAMLASGGGISAEATVLTRWGAGFADFWRNKWLVLRASIIGIFGGFVPAVGASASTWVAYGHARRSTKDRSRFGHGEIRGVAAAEGANNATIISDLVPTVLFSVPGGPAAAIFLGALFTFGYYPGPRMVSENPDLMFLIVWSVALTSVVGAALCFAITPYIARLTTIRFALLAAPLLLVMIIGAYQATNTTGDIAMLIVLGVVGWMMKQADWPRAPALVGYVLAKPMEQYFWLSNQLHGWSWLVRPGVLIIASFILIPLIVQLYRRAAAARRDGGTEETAPAAPVVGHLERPLVELGLAAAMVIAFAYAFLEMLGFAADSRLLPSLAIVPGFVFAVFVLAARLRRLGGLQRPPGGVTRYREPFFLMALVVYGVLVWAVGFNIATAALLAWMLFYCAGMKPLTGLIYGAIIFAAAHGLLTLMKLEAPPGALVNVI
ncbi:MAG: tripartite tricarboxylate transporter permease [Defluviicoccus sp.]|nr:tripartite tricarboxylate transporter permease [Defluviicoccus sp.]MDE0382616.1 tripartite tricarboxylate transporter permease [Defluviicoccus sp.]